MIAHEETAKTLSEELLSLYKKLENTVEIVARTESEEALQAYRVALTSVLSTMIFDVMEPLYKQHKHLAPPDWE
jgi:hypothetical protein